MKKLLSILLLTALLFSLCACNGNETKEYDETYTENANRDVMFRQVMMTDKGGYTNRYISGELYNGRSVNGLALCYYDKATGKTIYLCNKPECRHDGDSFCTATHRTLDVEYFTLSGDYIYISGVDYSEEGVQKNKIYRAKTDGTELSEVCTFQTVRGEVNRVYVSSSWYMFDMRIYGDYAIVPFCDYEKPTLMNDCTINTMVINLKTGEYNRVPDEIYENTRYKTTWINFGARGYYLYKGWLYYYLEEPINDGTGNANRYLYRYNLKSGENEKIDISLKFTSFAVYEDKVYYIERIKSGEPLSFYSYDMKTGELTDLGSAIASVRNEVAEGEADMQIPDAEILFDGTYFYFVYWSKDTSDSGFDNGYKCIIFSKDMEPLASFEAPATMEGFENYNIGIQGEIKISGGVAYIVTSCMPKYEDCVKDEEGNPIWVDVRRAICCPVEDIIAGKLNWEIAYDFYQFEIDNIDKDTFEYGEDW